MARPLLLKSAAELLAAVLAGTIPADAQMDKFFRAHPKMGGRDRGFVAETVYAALREKRVLEHVAQDATGEALIAACLVTQGHSARALADAGYRGDARALVERARTLDRATLPLAVRANFPDWMVERLRDQYGEDELLALAAALNRAAPVDLRVNTLKAGREEVQARLAEEGFPSEPTPLSPVGLRRHDRASLFRTHCFQDGLFEIQDEGSQLLSYLVEPKRHEMVVDFCAGAGGKSLHLGALMANSGTLYAFDISAHRLDRLKPRLARAGLSNVRAVAIRHERDDRVRRLEGKIDRVLVDAPCSGTGTLRRNPDIKWRGLDITALVADQARILDAAAKLAKPGGRLVYATCSLLREENDAVVSEFLSRHPEFRPLPAVEILARRHISLATAPVGYDTSGNPVAADCLTLLPHRHGTDGFFALAMERRT